MKKTIKTGSNQTFLVKGPAKIRIIEGEISVLGNTLGREESIVIARGKALPIQTVSEATLEVNMDNEEAIEPLNTPFPKEWKSVANIFNKLEAPAIIPILGDVDTGKTSLTTLLANTAFKKGFKVAIVDADVGQSSIGQPCFISMGVMEKTVSKLSEIKVKGAYFIGSNTPYRVMHRTVAGMEAMVKKALSNSAEIVLVDTSGWVYGRGARELKTTVILMLQPRILIALQRKNEIEHLLAPFENSSIRIIRLPAPETYKRSRENRKFLREILYRKSLEGGREITLGFEQIGLRYTLLGSGSQPDPEKIQEIKQVLGCSPVYAEESPDLLYVILPDEEVEMTRETTKYLEKRLRKLEVYIAQKKDFENLLVAFQDQNNEHSGIGIIKRVDFKNRKITFYTSAKKEKIKFVQFGLLKVSEEGEELGRTRIL